MDPISSYPPIPSTSNIDSDNGTSTKAGVADRVREKLDGVAHTAGDVAARAKTSVRDAAGRVQERAGDVTRSSRQMVIGHPLRSMAASLGVGVVIGLLLARAMR
jgi:ElaB/YqjD/DUF883 family membrane-anchored ribosome-binding protein